MLADDTGSATTSYTDNSVAAETTYAYAVRARNVHGLGPQSDPVTATTLAAPYPPPKEPGIARAIAGAEFTLGGQRLDTGGSCTQDDVASISSGCTVNVQAETRFAVDGTLDGDDRLTVETGRDKDNLTQHGSDGDLRGTNQGVDLTFPPGRNILRVWGDEDESSGGDEEHFFRVNVVPVWFLNGEQLSKDSACRSSSDRTASDITDSNCIVEVDPSAPTFRFKDVLNAHYNAYVKVNGTEVITTPNNVALGGSWMLAFQDGDNVLRVRLARKVEEAAQNFHSDAFWYKVTVTNTLVSNTGQTDGSPAPVTNTTHLAQQFTTGSETNGYEVAAVVVNIKSGPTGTFALAIHRDNAGEPGAKVRDLVGSPTDIGEYGFTPASPTTLTPSTNYFVVFRKTTVGSTSFVTTDSDAEDSSSAANWSIGDGSVGSTDSGANWVARTPSMEIAIKGKTSTVAPEPTVCSSSGGVSLENVPTIFVAGWPLDIRDSTINDDDGVENATFTHKWERLSSDCAAVDVTPSSSADMYLLAFADVGSKLRYTVSFQDDGGNAETRDNITPTIKYSSGDGSGYTDDVPNVYGPKTTANDHFRTQVSPGQTRSGVLNSGSDADHFKIVPPAAWSNYIGTFTVRSNATGEMSISVECGLRESRTRSEHSIAGQDLAAGESVNYLVPDCRSETDRTAPYRVVVDTLGKHTGGYSFRFRETNYSEDTLMPVRADFVAKDTESRFFDFADADNFKELVEAQPRSGSFGSLRTSGASAKIDYIYDMDIFKTRLSPGTYAVKVIATDGEENWLPSITVLQEEESSEYSVVTSVRDDTTSDVDANDNSAQTPDFTVETSGEYYAVVQADSFVEYGDGNYRISLVNAG